MAEHPNLTKLRAAYDAYVSGDVEAATADWAEDIVWHAGAAGPLNGDYKGRAEVIGFLASLMQETGGTFKLEIRDMVADDNSGAVRAMASADRKGKHLDQEVCHYLSLNDQGQVTEFWAFVLDADKQLEFWA